ncbi:hypothetical protein GCM10011391_07000 [Pullulanibacillus camelliae]|uniref:VOC domain-containing protein n=1 Tax=Pullulanibacillus camelliae TaxID=1707096 RepID=A0A8J2VL42_9BACL|nr:hypothetical protein GCM10011391_07000 [Pullulanibacillus camelliae]
MQIKGLNHFLFSVTDLDKSITFYQHIFGAKLLVKDRKTAYFDLKGLWLALNGEDDMPRHTHIACLEHWGKELCANL